MTNVLVRRYGWDADVALEAIRDLDDLGIETVAIDRPLLLLALELAVRYGITTYDAAHLALAEAADARLITLDEDLARVAGPRAAIRARGTRESPEPYGTPAGRALDWTRHGRYLAELRRSAGLSPSRHPAGSGA